VVFAQSPLVLVIREGLGPEVTHVADLATADVHGIALPEGDLSTIGAFGTELLDLAGIREAVAPKTTVVRLPMEALAMLALKEVDVTMCTLSCPLKTMPAQEDCDTHRTRIKAVAGQPLLAIIPDIPTREHHMLWFGGVVLQCSAQKRLAGRFLAALTSPPCQKALEGWNLDLEDPIRSPCGPAK